MKRRDFIKQTGATAMLSVMAPMAITNIMCSARKGMQIYDLQCEYMTDPLGIDTPIPRLSWKLSDKTRGQRQTGYQVLVASSKSLLDKEQADIWDSGLVSSAQSALVAVGKKLASGQECFWKVRVLDKDKKRSDWSTVARFSMGLLLPGDWSGKWIKHPDAAAEKHIWFRKNIDLAEKVDTAFLYLASVGYHELYINGHKVDTTILAPSLTRLDKRVLYVTYDIRKLLQPGANTIAIWYGPGWSRYGYFKTHQALKVQLAIKTMDGKTSTIATDESWRCKTSFSENTGSTKYDNNGGEKIDAAAYIPGWNKVDFDDTQWKPAASTVIEAVLSSQIIAPTRVIETIPAKEITGTGPYRIDMGINFTGWAEIKMKQLSAGDRVIIKVADGLDAVQDFGQQSEFVSNGNPEEVFKNRFNYIAGRYITIEGLKQKPELSDITCFAIGNDLKRVGQFSSSNDLFNKIYEMDLWTYRANTIEGFTSDCPHRERLGYGEENFATAWGCGLPNYQTGAFYTKLVRDWCDVQEENGWIHHTAPQINEHYGGPMWSSAPLNISWEFYQTYGDKQLLRNVYPTGKRWLEFLKSKESDGLLRSYSSEWGTFLGDWAAPGHRQEKGGTPEALFFNNCVYVMNLDTFVQIARLLGETADAELYAQRSLELKKEIHSQFFNPATNTYMSGQQVQQAFPMHTNITPAHLVPMVYANFEQEIRLNKPYLDMGSSGLPVLLKYLIEDAGRNDILFEHLSKTTEPGYGYFIKRGETTWPEYWDVDVASKIHTCYTGIASWFMKGLGGIRPDPAHPGYQSFIIKPAVVGDLKFVNATTASLYGTIVSQWEKKNDVVEMNITIPVNTMANVYVPTNDVNNITEGGMAVRSAAGITFLKMDGQYAVLQVQSGEYKFQSKL
ncbi:family 78 glycoside hydrolase catalytic domain [Chitinophaga sp. MM2321]|uniref:family 78 glycoside hydrolase catalytic domain n=1 Tax=Chitinophaga sp. MM2321 TaxID=3137178 RepID=UPI0032D5821E